MFAYNKKNKKNFIKINSFKLISKRFVIIYQAFALK